MTSKWCGHEGDTVLLVEGENDCHVVLALCARFGLAHNFGIFQCGNDSRAIQRMNALIASSVRPTIIGLVVDADNPSLDAKWQSISAKINPHGYTLPDRPASGGTILDSSSGGPRLGFWLMPDNQTSGMLEDFCIRMMPIGARLFIEETLQQAKNAGLATFKDVHLSKAIVHSYLAWQDEPGRPLGQAITANTLAEHSPTSEQFAEWLSSLFQGAQEIDAPI